MIGIMHRLTDIEVESTGEFGAALDYLAEHGVRPEEGRQFATWLQTTIEGFIDREGEYKEAYQDLCDKHPEQLPVAPVAAEFYHPTREAAQAVLAKLMATDVRIANGVIQLEPNNGWVVVLVPKPADLSDIAHLAEIQDGSRRPAPADRVKQPRTAPDKPQKGPPGASAGGGEGVAPTKGATALVWSIADRVVKDLGKVDRPAIIAACVAQGINPATAGTQYSKWKKAKGY